LAAWQVWSRAGPSPAGVQSTVLPLPSSARTPTAPNPPPRLSIVVLPFANLSNDPEQEYFTDGITDDLTTDLSRITDSFVIARTTAFAYKSKPVNVKQIGRDLGVRYILEGSVRRLGEQVQVNVQLIDAESGAHVWADRFDTDRTNLARAQGDIVSRLAQTLQVELLEAASRRIELEKPINPDARDFVMRGWAGWYRPETAAQLQEDMRLFERALELEPQSADAKVGIATVLIESVTVTWSKSREQDVARAEQLLTEALERDRNNPRLFWAMGLLRRLQNRLVDSKIAFENAIALDHNNAASMLQLGFTLDTLGQPEVALPYFEKAIRLNPRAQNIHFYHFGLGSCYLLQNQIDRAVDYLEKANASKPQYYIIPLYLSAALALNGKIPEAKAALADAIKLKPQIRSLAVLPKYNVGLSNPSYAALAAKTLYVGLRRAGLPDE
jgi:TolB-like protein/Flp pilus assembly protein TadD